MARVPLTPQLEAGAVLGALIDKVALANTDVPRPLTSDAAAAFDCNQAPSQPFSKYMKRFSRFQSSEVLWLQAAVLVSRLQRDAQCPVTPCTVHRLMVTAFAIVVKLTYDCNDAGPVVARFGGIPLDELNDMERTFLTMVDWHILVWPNEFQALVEAAPNLKAYAGVLEEGCGGVRGAPLIPDSVWWAMGNVNDMASSCPTPAGSFGGSLSGSQRPSFASNSSQPWALRRISEAVAYARQSGAPPSEDS